MEFNHVVNSSVETMKRPDLFPGRRLTSKRAVECFLIRMNSEHALAHSSVPGCFLFEKIGPLDVLSL